MLKGFKYILNSIPHFSLVLVQCITSLAQAVTSQTEDREHLKRPRVSIVIIPKYLFESDGFMMN